jgi:hypothetical protein
MTQETMAQERTPKSRLAVAHGVIFSECPKLCPEGYPFRTAGRRIAQSEAYFSARSKL